jgi:hypothetical protein
MICYRVSRDLFDNAGRNGLGLVLEGKKRSKLKMK